MSPAFVPHHGRVSRAELGDRDGPLIALIFCWRNASGHWMSSCWRHTPISFVQIERRVLGATSHTPGGSERFRQVAGTARRALCPRPTRSCAWPRTGDPLRSGSRWPIFFGGFLFRINCHEKNGAHFCCVSFLHGDAQQVNNFCRNGNPVWGSGVSGGPKAR